MAAAGANRISLSLLLRFYGLARLLFAPNPELIDMLVAKTGRPTYPMHRGVDTNLFSPERRERSDSTFIIGYVGRLSPEKNVRMLADLEQILIKQGASDYRFLIVGDGSERSWLAEHMKRCELPGVLLGTELARAYAGMDMSVFPSCTDTFGNVILESLASGVPAIVSNSGGPKFLVQTGATGFVAEDSAEFARYVRLLQGDAALRHNMSLHARRAASALSWPAIFERVYEVYAEARESGFMAPPAHTKRNRPALSSAAL